MNYHTEHRRQKHEEKVRRLMKQGDMIKKHRKRIEFFVLIACIALPIIALFWLIQIMPSHNF